MGVQVHSVSPFSPLRMHPQVPNNGDRGWASFTLLLIELNLIVWVGWYTDRWGALCCAVEFGGGGGGTVGGG